MGLNFSHCKAHWSYSGFGDFRARLAAEIGITLSEMAGFGGSRSWDRVSDPLKLLLNHSDWDGDLSPDQCLLVAPRLREVVASSSDEGTEGYHKEQALLLAEGMERAAKAGESLQFR